MSEKMSISLEKEHVRVVERFGARIGVKQFSTALQALIHQFDQQQKSADADKQPAESTVQPA